MNPQEQRCQACRARAADQVIESEEPRQPYLLCSGCAHRLQKLSLRPSEWFHLAALHGPQTFLLHDDFYAQDGTALVPKEDVVEPSRYPAPTLDQARADPERLVDYAMAQYTLGPEVIAALHAHDRLVILRSLQERVDTGDNLDIECRAYQICAQALGPAAEQWVRERWSSYRPETLFCLAEASSRCLPPDEGFQRVAEALDVLPLSGKRELCGALAWFRSERALAWLEQNVEPPVIGRWGHLAALSREPHVLLVGHPTGADAHTLRGGTKRQAATSA